MRNRAFFILTCLLLAAGLPGTGSSDTEKISVVTSIFPLYEIVREVSGDAVVVSLLLPPGTEPHTWDPRPSDIIKVRRSRLFIYMGPEMEPWVLDVLKSTASEGPQALEILPLIKESSPEDPEGAGSGSSKRRSRPDPHIWLDFSNTVKMVRGVSEALEKELPEMAETISENSERYIEKLKSLDRKYAADLAACSKKQFVFGGHSAFDYLAARYGLVQIPLYGVSPDSEPSPRQLAQVVRTIKKLDLRVVYFEELINPRLAMVIAEETGASTAVLNPGANLTNSQWETGMTFISMMEQNLESLKKGLNCEQQ